MLLKSLFKKDINRSIETVIKADDRDNILQEVDEYVVTNEISKKLTDFFESYNNFDGINGVWISGFFGSGKSHLLKILSYILENITHNGKHLGELFANKVVDDAKLKADILACTRIDSESILFNIDQQAQITSKADANAILEVFYKVFYDHLGFYGFRSHVAEFELWLHKEGKYESFKKEFENENGKPWIKARVDYIDPLVSEAITEACGKIFNTDSSKYEDILDKYDERQKFSIEDFAEKVNDYIKTKSKGFRLNFFVDEIGQYIADNTKLMLNLQTIAESLATRCKGQSWIIVTSQEDLERVVGDDKAIQSNDFSKIIGRFRIRIPLTSANVDEVIEKRLLEKNNDAEAALKKMWTAEKDNLATILSFSEAGVQFKFYKGENDFIAKYPFIPYQFDLFQQCIKALSRHNAFQGKHSSVGERNMLGTFQEVLKDVENKDARSFISYDKLFEGIRATIKGEIQNAVTLAEKQLSNQLAIRILKALFLVKYYDSFKTTRRNIAVLLNNSMDVDLKEHEKAIEEALNILEQQTYVHRNGDIYEYLTDDEKDIEDEIKATDIDPGQLTIFFNEVIFDEIIRDNRIKYIDNKQDFEFSRKVDGISFSREK
jgi:energy-coupling factor transporter ATP-binding protein EcfA2